MNERIVTKHGPCLFWAGVLGLSGACAPGLDQPVRVPPSPASASNAASTPEPLVDPAAAARVDALIARYVEARGGLDKLRALRSLRLTGRARYGTGPGKFGADDRVEAEYAVAYARPGRVRSEVTYQSLTGVDGFDKEAGWNTEPWKGR